MEVINDLDKSHLSGIERAGTWVQTVQKRKPDREQKQLLQICCEQREMG